MNNHVFWIFEFAVNEGQFNKLTELMEEMVAATIKNEPETIGYEWTVSEDNRQCHIHERYADSDATVKHLKTFVEQYAGRLMELGNATRFVVYGNPNNEVKQALDGFGAVYMPTIGGFHR
jgi:quinol monooxygenase YgiN